MARVTPVFFAFIFHGVITSLFGEGFYSASAFCVFISAVALCMSCVSILNVSCQIFSARLLELGYTSSIDHETIFA